MTLAMGLHVESCRSHVTRHNFLHVDFRLRRGLAKSTLPSEGQQARSVQVKSHSNKVVVGSSTSGILFLFTIYFQTCHGCVYKFLLSRQEIHITTQGDARNHLQGKASVAKKSLRVFYRTLVRQWQHPFFYLAAQPVG